MSEERPKYGTMIPELGENAMLLHQTLQPHSVEISRGKDGKVGIAVKVYGSLPEGAAEEAHRVFRILAERYPV